MKDRQELKPGRICFCGLIIFAVNLVMLLAAMNVRSQNAPRSSSAPPTKDSSDYLIGAGDVLDIRVFGKPELSREAVRVDTRGMIRMPLIEGEIQASCRTEAILAQHISTEYLKYVRRPQVDVFIHEYNSQPVAVVGVGNVMRPSIIPLKEPLTVSRAIAMSGGVLPYSKMDRVRIIRQPPGNAAKQEMGVDLKAIERKHADDIVLQANDIVDVPVSGGKRLLGNLVGSIGPAVTQMPVRIIP